MKQAIFDKNIPNRRHQAIDLYDLSNEQFDSIMIHMSQEVCS